MNSNTKKININDIEMSYTKRTNRYGCEVWDCTLWVKGKKKETKISFQQPAWMSPEPPTIRQIIWLMVEKSRYTVFDYYSWCDDNGWDYNSRSLSDYKHCCSVAKKLHKLNEGHPYFDYTLIAYFTQTGGYGWAWIADDDWESVEKKQYFRVYKLNPKTNTNDLNDRLLRVMRDRYPKLFHKQELEYRQFKDRQKYCYIIAYFFADGQWGIEQCELERGKKLFLQGAIGMYKIQKYSHTDIMADFSTKSYRRWKDLLHSKMRLAHGIKPIERTL